MAIIIPEVNPEPLPNVRAQPAASLETFGGGAGAQAVSQENQKLANAAAEIAEFEKIRADQTAVQEASASLSALNTDLLTNPKTGLPSYKGTNAMAGQDKLWTEFRKGANKIASTLTGQQQQGAFTKIALSMGDSFNQYVNAHVSKELEKHDEQTFSSLLENETQRGAMAYGNDHILNDTLSKINGFAEARAQRLGLDENEKKKFMRQIHTNYHETVLSQMVNDPGALKQAKAYFSAHREDMDVESQDRVRNLFDVVPKQQEEASKKAKTDYYNANMRQAMLDMFDGKLTLSEAQRRFRQDILDKSDYNILESRLNKPDAAAMRSFLISDPETFNTIRQAQLSGSKDPGEIQRMIAKGAASKDVTPDDAKYLLTINSERPPTSRDRYIEAAANNIRDFGNRYFAETNFFGMPKNKDKTSRETEALLTDFYTAVDKAKAQQGEQIDELRDRVLKTAMQNRYPGLGSLEKAPDVVIDIKGKVARLLNPDQHSVLQPRYRIVPFKAPKKEEQ
jgi:hypothetical protein